MFMVTGEFTMRGFVATILGLMALTASLCVHAEETEGRYKLSNGFLQGPVENPLQVTIMLDTVTGKSWFLVTVESKAKWMPIIVQSAIGPEYLPTISE
jgi:hypothetical protein